MISIHQASSAYRKVNATSLPPLTAVCQVLSGISVQLEAATRQMEKNEPDFRDTLLIVQQLLFELMAMTNIGTEEGNRLLTLYIYANQTVVTASLQNDPTPLIEVREIIDTLHTDWQHVRQTQTTTIHI